MSDSSDSDPDTLSGSDQDSDHRADTPEPEDRSANYKIPKTGKRIWTDEQIENLKKNFRNLENLDKSILGCLTFKEMAAMGGKRDKGNRILTEKLAENFERVRTFPVRVEAGEDHCTGVAHKARFLRGYVGNSQNLWVQARTVMGLTGLDSISNYETVSVGLNGYVGSRVWHEVHSPSSKALSIRMLTHSAMKSAWNAKEKEGDEKGFDSVQEIRMAVVVLDTCIRKVMPWNFAFTTVSFFLHTVNFGEGELGGRVDHLDFVADFVDEILRYNAQAWDEERYFMSAQEVAAKWSALLLRHNADSSPAKGASVSRDKKPDSAKGAERAKQGGKVPPGVCKLFQNKDCKHTGNKHSAPWDASYILRHVCAEYLKDKKRFCMGDHPRVEHK